MEIFKAASRQIDNSIALNQTKHNPQVRDVEHTKIQQNVVQDKSSIQAKNDAKELNMKVSEITKRLNKNMEQLQTNIRFAYNDKISLLYVNVMEANTGRVIRKIPTEEVMNLTEHFREIVGVLFDKKE